MILQTSREPSIILFPFFGAKGRIPYLRKDKKRTKCVCGVRPKKFHRSSCKEELCPECYRKLITCGCRNKIKTDDGE